MNQTGRTSPAGGPTNYMAPGQPPTSQQQRMGPQHPGAPAPHPSQQGVNLLIVT